MKAQNEKTSAGKEKECLGWEAQVMGGLMPHESDGA